MVELKQIKKKKLNTILAVKKVLSWIFLFYRTNYKYCRIINTRKFKADKRDTNITSIIQNTVDYSIKNILKIEDKKEHFKEKRDFLIEDNKYF